MFSVSWIVSVAVLVISFLGIVLCALFFTKPVDEYKFSFMRIFPFEVLKNSENYGKFYSFFIYLFAGMCFSPLIIIVGQKSDLSALNPMSILITCLLGLGGLCFIFLNIFDVTHVKPHLSLFVVFAGLIVLSGTLIFVRGFTAYNLFADHGHKEILFLLTEILAGLSVVYSLLFIVNPKLRVWARLDNINGEYKRPKRFVLAYSEWGLLLALFFNELVFFVQLLK